MAKRPSNVVILSFLLFCLASGSAYLLYVRNTRITLELNQIFGMKIEQVAASPVTIKISGTAAHSAFVVSKITSSQTHDRLEIFVYLTLVTVAPKGLTGNLEYFFVVPMSVNTVTFGNEKTVIWNRDTGSLRLE